MRKFRKIHKINKYSELIKIIQGELIFGDLRQDYIFRGLKKSKYELIPSALRKNEKEDYEITKFIANSEFELGLYTDLIQYAEDFNEIILPKTNQNINYNAFINRTIDKHGNITGKRGKTPFVRSASQLQFKREIYVLLKFLNYCDRIGLRIQVNENVRKYLHNFTRYEYEENEVIWPNSEFFEIISLAQHYGLPTRALDWTYDYKVALYFAVKDALKEDSEDCVLWAFNYKLFENNYGVCKYYNETPKIEIYRPEYNSNPNLNAQKGLFTFWSNKTYDNLLDDTSFDELIILELLKNDPTTKYYKIEGYEPFEIPENIKIFHKFIIPARLKIEILKELYYEGYTNEYIYPNYQGVVDSIRNEVKLDEYLQSEKNHH